MSDTDIHTLVDPGGRGATDLPASCFVVGDSCSASRGTADTDGAVVSAYSIRVARFRRIREKSHRPNCTARVSHARA